MQRRDFLKLSGAALATSAFGVLNDNQTQKVPYKILNDGNKMPLLGYGTFLITEPKECVRCVLDAFSVGYRLIDTAQGYGNEQFVGEAIKQSGLKRDEIFITTKLWVSNVNEKDALKSFDISAKKLGLDYVDLLLIHQPYNDVYGAWRAMSRLKSEGRVKSIGVSNFYGDKLLDFYLNNEIKPAVNQLECNAFHQRLDEQKLLDKLGVAFEGWAPFGEGRNDMFKNEILAKIAQKHGKSVAQVILRWHLQRGIIAIPKTTRKERMVENFNIFDFALDESDLVQILALNTNKSLFFDHRNLDDVSRLNSWKL